MKNIIKPGEFKESDPVSKRVKKTSSSEPKYRPILSWSSGRTVGWTVTLKGLPGKPIHKP